jgi:transposase
MSRKISFKTNFHGMSQLFLPSLDDLVPKDAPVRLVSNIVDNLDLTSLMATYDSMGASNYDARVMLKVVFYSYMCNIYSCRKIEKQMRENVLYMWLSGMMSPVPSFNTINRFRSKHLKSCITDLFVQVVLMLVDMGQLDLKEVHLDGSKFESAANRYRFVWSNSVKHNKEKLQQKISKILEQIDEGIAQDNQSEDEERRGWDSKDLQSRLNELNCQNKKKAEELGQKKTSGEKVSRQERNALRKEEKCARQLEECAGKLREYEHKEEMLGGRNSCTTTDPDATMMRMKKEDCLQNGLTLPAYNPQIGTQNQFIVGYLMAQTSGDMNTLPAFVRWLKSAYDRVPEALVADGGYGSEENYTVLEQECILPYVKYSGFDKEQKREVKNSISWVGNLYYNAKEDYYVCPMGQHMTLCKIGRRPTSNGFMQEFHQYKAVRCQGCPLRCLCHDSKTDRVITVNHNLNRLREIARTLLTSEEGIRKRKRRCHEPEAVFGQIKGNKQYNRFRHYGLEKVSMDFGIFAVAFNIGKLYNRLLAMSQNGLGAFLRAIFSCLSLLFGSGMRPDMLFCSDLRDEEWKRLA